MLKFILLAMTGLFTLTGCPQHGDSHSADGLDFTAEYYYHVGRPHFDDYRNPNPLVFTSHSEYAQYLEEHWAFYLIPNALF